MFEFFVDSIGVDRLPAYVKKPADITEGNLLELAKNSGIQLAILDDRIPGAFVISGRNSEGARSQFPKRRLKLYRSIP